MRKAARWLMIYKEEFRTQALGEKAIWPELGYDN